MDLEAAAVVQEESEGTVGMSVDQEQLWNEVLNHADTLNHAQSIHIADDFSLDEVDLTEFR